MAGPLSARRVWLVAVGVIVAVTTMIGVVATLNRRAAEERERKTALVRAADLLRSVVDESLEELRAREDARPFDQYNEVYRPEGVVAASDAVAPSPLSRAPDDKRILGWFQVNPDGSVTLPHDNSRPLEAQRVRDVVGGEPFALVRALARPPDAPPAAFAIALNDPPAPKKIEPTQKPKPKPKPKPTTTTTTTTAPPVIEQAVEPQSAKEEAPAPKAAPSTQTVQELNRASTEVYKQLQDAEPEPQKRAALAENKKLPQIARNDVDWSDNELGNLSTRAQKSSKRTKKSGSYEGIEVQGTISSGNRGSGNIASLGNVDVTQAAQPPAPQVEQNVAPSNAGDARVVTPTTETPPAVKAAPPVEVKPKPKVRAKKPVVQDLALDKAPVQSEAANVVAVDYTPMVFDTLGGARVMHRIVSTGGGSTVQGVIFDEDALQDSWLPGLLLRRVGSTASPRIIPATMKTKTACALRVPVSEVLDDLDLCFADVDVEPLPVLEIGLLMGLLLLVLAALGVLERAAQRADNLTRQKSAFISAISHELRTPLTTLRMHAELLRDGLIPEPAKQHRFHDDMVKESVRLGHLVENVLEAQRLEEGRRPLRLARLDLGEVVADIAASQRALCESRQFTIACVLPDDDVDLTGSFDRQAVEQIVVNLVENAVKYARDADDRTIHVDVRRTERGGGEAVVVVVADHGPGIPDGEREKVFHRFHRVQRAGEDHIAGTGLGLALVRELARAHGGEARVVDRSGFGCAVEVTFPLR
ncbi:MAG: ATP-binding protein [Deltaproteobacteria bacterium]|nr:ATP-binding protein [Deltaproteobacteria bacterium]